MYTPVVGEKKKLMMILKLFWVLNQELLCISISLHQQSEVQQVQRHVVETIVTIVLKNKETIQIIIAKQNKKVIDSYIRRSWFHFRTRFLKTNFKHLEKNHLKLQKNKKKFKKHTVGVASNGGRPTSSACLYASHTGAPMADSCLPAASTRFKIAPI